MAKAYFIRRADAASAWEDSTHKNGLAFFKFWRLQAGHSWRLKWICVISRGAFLNDRLTPRMEFSRIQKYNLMCPFSLDLKSEGVKKVDWQWTCRWLLEIYILCITPCRGGQSLDLHDSDWQRLWRLVWARSFPWDFRNRLRVDDRHCVYSSCCFSIEIEQPQQPKDFV